MKGKDSEKKYGVMTRYTYDGTSMTFPSRFLVSQDSEVAFAAIAVAQNSVKVNTFQIKCNLLDNRELIRQSNMV